MHAARWSRKVSSRLPDIWMRIFSMKGNDGTLRTPWFEPVALQVEMIGDVVIALNLVIFVMMYFAHRSLAK
jgi:hypothetical protein